MVYYQAYCNNDSFTSSLYTRLADARRSAFYHKRRNPGHSVGVRKVFIPNIRVDSEELI